MHTKRGIAVDAVWGLLVLLASALGVLAATPYGSATSPDSIAYLDIAAHFAAGDGWRATDFSLATGGAGATVENRIWPPLYPLLLSLVVEDYADVHGAAQVSAALLALTGGLAYVLLRRSLPSVLAAAATCTILFSGPIVTAFAYAWSETLFIPLMLLATLLAVTYVEQAKARARMRAMVMLALVATLIATAMTRYIGLCMVVLLPLAFIASKRDLTDRILVALGALLYAVFVGSFLAQNYLVAGTLSGGPRSPSELPLSANLWHLWESFVTVMPDALHIVAACAVAAAVVAWGLALLAHRRRDEALRDGRDLAGGFLFCVACTYVAALLALRTYSRFDEIDIRLLAPAWIPLLVGCVLLSWRFVTRARSGGVLAAILLLLPLGSFAQGLRVFDSAIESWRNTGSPNFPMRNDIVFNNFTRDPARNRERAVISAVVAEESLLVTERAAIWRFLSGLNVRELPARLDREALESLVVLPGGAFVMLPKPRARALIAQLGVSTEQVSGVDLGTVVLLRVSSAWLSRGGH